MGRTIVILAAAVAGVTLVGGLATYVADTPTRVKVPPAVSYVPGAPRDCVVQPRSLSSVQSLIAASPAVSAGSAGGVASPTPVNLASSSRALGSRAEQATARPVDAETVEAVREVMREYLTCVNTGDLLRTYALFTDDFTRERVTQIAAVAPIDESLANAQPVPPAEWPSYLAVREVKILPNGRMIARVIVGEDPSLADGWPGIVAFVQEGDRFLIDDISG